MSRQASSKPLAAHKKVFSYAFIKGKDRIDSQFISIADERTLLAQTEDGSQKTFQFDKIYGSLSRGDQSDPLITEPLVESLFNGRSSTLLTCGNENFNAKWLFGEDFVEDVPRAPVPEDGGEGFLRRFVSRALTKLDYMREENSLRSVLPLGLCISAFQICGTLFFDGTTLTQLDNERLIDLISKDDLTIVEDKQSKVVWASQPKLVGVSGLQELNDIITLITLNVRARNDNILRSHVVLRCTLRFPHDAVTGVVKPQQPRNTSALSDHLLNTPQDEKVLVTEKEAHVSLDIFTLAPVSPNKTSNKATREDVYVRQSLLNLGHQFEGLLGTAPPVGLSWNSFKMTHLLRNAFQSNKSLYVTVHTNARKTDVNPSLWSLAFASSVRKLCTSNELEHSGHFGEISGELKTLDGSDYLDGEVLGKFIEQAEALLREALSNARTEKIKLVHNHTSLQTKLEERLAAETEARKKAEEELKLYKRKSRENEEKLKKKLEAAQTELEDKHKQLKTLKNAVDLVSTESNRKLEALEKVVQARNEFYRNKFHQQESLFKSQSEVFKEMQNRVSELVNSKIMLLKKNQQAKRAARSREEDAAASPSMNGHSAVEKNERSQEEFEILQRLQTLISEQASQISTFNDKIITLEQLEVGICSFSASSVGSVSFVRNIALILEDYHHLLPFNEVEGGDKSSDTLVIAVSSVTSSESQFDHSQIIIQETISRPTDYEFRRRGDPSMSDHQKLRSSSAALDIHRIDSSGLPVDPILKLVPPKKTFGFIKSIQRLRDKAHIRPLIVESIGSFWFIFVLIMSVGGYVIGTEIQAAKLTTAPPLGDWVSSIASLALAVTYGAYMSFHISGGHLSPAITVTNAVLRGFPWKYVPFYLFAHFIGAFFAAICFYGLQTPYLNLIDPNRTAATAALYVNLPSPVIWSDGYRFINEFLGCTIFMFILSALTDLKNPLLSFKATPIYAGTAVFMVANVFGWNNFVLNPFRDFGPRVYLSIYYKGLWQYHNYWAIALFVPFMGHIAGALLYDILVAKDYDDDEKK
ncbi:hypothetical protein PROFUN_10383 [Planoprotostelium fungivorum]|uniref:Kinesin motor domain-containing protein n=1 Tax=Planoprotostelium fungivorum TaxID=1890364 RepID=A0A2P6NEF3_9EUKA|nr:hypothetical protein PROFUN_10383 [Planoprotostelium fungivorum]